MQLEELAEKNLEALRNKSYPGRGMIIGAAPQGGKIVQVYWIMGRSENSRNRVFLQDEKQWVKTRAFDESKMKDPSLIIYYPVKTFHKIHILTNGDQTDSIKEAVKKGETFEDALSDRFFEEDPPNLTPRISGIVDLNTRNEYAYKLAIIKSINNTEDYFVRHFYNYSDLIEGFGHCLTTYVDDGSPLPSFEGEPYLLPIPASEEETLDLYWQVLESEHLISMLVKSIDIEDNTSRVVIKNKHQ